jgi:galactokinase/mevalonate kinase-like predicted kinase
MGAGGGGFTVFHCRFERKHRVAEALRKMGRGRREFSFAYQGLLSWRAHDAAARL